MTAEQSLRQVLSDYYAAFSTLDIQAVLPYFHQPALLIGPQGIIALPTPTALVPVFGPVMEGLRRQNYQRSEFDLQLLKLLDGKSALATGVAVRYTRVGKELSRAGLTYLLRKTGETWKFAVMVLHDL
jgi:ketosteroid isomerase-like protein